MSDVQQQEMFDVEHLSLQLRRATQRMPERVYLEHWRKLNVRHPSVNRGFTALEWILTPDGHDHPAPISRRDARVAASVVQWLGTNCGMGFLRSAEDEIRKRDHVGRDVFPLTFYRPKPRVRAIEV
jgi:hypothetical protein